MAVKSANMTPVPRGQAEPTVKLEFRLKESEYEQFLNLLTWVPSDAESYQSNSSDTFRKIFKAGLMWVAEDPAARMSQIRMPKILPMAGVERLPLPSPKPRVLKGGHHPEPQDDTDNVHKAERDLGPPGVQSPKAEPPRKSGDKGTRKSGDPRQHGPSKAKIRKRDAGPDTPEERREREGR